MNKKTIILIAALGAIVFSSGCIQPPVCGNNICELLEDVVNCPNDCRVAFCGNAKCEAGENSTNCPKDCPAEKMCTTNRECGISTICCSGKCITPACSLDRDCDDKNPATTDRCLNPATCNAACSNTKILERCGDGICSASEDDYACPEDCGYY